jgi:peptidoglycan hydrolase-like protein with peptidoglycan-binding domain
MMQVRAGLALASMLFLASCAGAVGALPDALFGSAGGLIGSKVAQESSGEHGATGRTDQKHDLTRNIQAGLITLGYDPGPADGRLDTKTRDAIRRFQFDNTLPLNGEPSVYLWDDIKDRI